MSVGKVLATYKFVICLCFLVSISGFATAQIKSESKGGKTPKVKKKLKQDQEDPVAKEWNQTFQGKYQFVKRTGKKGAEKKGAKESDFRINVNKKMVTMWLGEGQQRCRWEKVTKKSGGYLVKLALPKDSAEKSVELEFKGDQLIVNSGSGAKYHFEKTKSKTQAKIQSALDAGEIEVKLEREVVGRKRKKIGVEVSPRKVSLKKEDESLVGTIAIGRSQKFPVQLKVGENAKSATLSFDANQDGKFDSDEQFKMSKVKDTKGAFRTAVEAKLGEGKKSVSYTMEVHYRTGKAKESGLSWKPVHRSIGNFKAGSIEGRFFLVDKNHDGVLDEKDAWGLGSKKAGSLTKQPATLGKKKVASLQGVGFELISIDPKKMTAKIKAVSLPGKVAKKKSTTSSKKR